MNDFNMHTDDQTPSNDQTPGCESMVDQLILGELSFEDPSVVAALAQNDALAKELRSLQRTLQVIGTHVPVQPIPHETEVSVPATSSKARSMGSSMGSSMARRDQVQSLIEAHSNPAEALANGGKPRLVVLRWVLPAAAVLLAWALLQKGTAPVQDPTERIMLGNQTQTTDRIALHATESFGFKLSELLEAETVASDRSEAGSFAVTSLTFLDPKDESRELFRAQVEPFASEWTPTTEQKAILASYAKVPLRATLASTSSGRQKSRRLDCFWTRE